MTDTAGQRPADTHDTGPDAAHMRAQIARLASLARQSAASAAAQALRASAEGHEARVLRSQLAAMQASLFWRLTGPLRVAVDLARGAPPQGSPGALRIRRLLGLARREGLGAVLQRFRQSRAARRRPPPRIADPRPDPSPPAADLPPPGAILAPCVLIIAELTLPQCAKYRVWQKQEHFTRLGIPCRVVDWRFETECLAAAALATQAILYRVPYYPAVQHLIAVLHRLRVPTAWEVDDLIFDAALFLQNRNLDSLDAELRQGILSGVDLYRDAMRACGAGIASTPHLAKVMRDAGLADVSVVENALDDETLGVAARLRAARAAAAPRPDVLITYGSGTKTHDADFQQAAPALLQLLRQAPHVRLRIVGELNLPSDFAAFAGRMERFPPTLYARYLELLSESDISIAPLEPTLFNDAKSNIKFLEAAILGIASVCSPRAHFTDAVIDGENGCLAESEADWLSALTALVQDADLRKRIGEAALRTALDRYAPEQVARSQVAPLLARAPDTRPRGKLRVLFANVYYAPRSYGGATLVVEEMARRLHARGDTDVHVVTSLDTDAADQAMTRYVQDGIPVFALPVSPGNDVAAFDNPLAGEDFGRVLDAVQPHVVHLHAIQWLSASLAAACAARGIPYVITVHDAWWLCARQFMVTGEGKYCFQTTIDLRVCQNCNPGARHLALRQDLLKAALDGAALILSPGAAHRDLYIANGVPPERIAVAPNGVALPKAPVIRTPAENLRFAYVGGSVDIKGFSIVRRAFEALPRSDWHLVLVDNTLNLGFSSVQAEDWQVRGTLAVVPAYAQTDLDRFFADIDVLVFPSQWKESFGLTVREALARDVWVIATDAGGPAEVIADGINGTLIPLDGRHESLQAAIDTLLNRPGRLANHRNPLAGTILNYDAQATNLRALLAQIAASTRIALGERVA